MTKNIIIGILLFTTISLGLGFYSKNQNTTGETDVLQKDNGTSTTTEIKTSNTLILSNQNLSSLPKSVLSNTEIEILDISKNEISGALPAEIKILKELKVLNASNNNMTGIPAEIGQLSNLEILDLSNNMLTGLPYELSNLKKLKELNLSGNNYSAQDLEVIKQGLSKDCNIIL